MPPSHYGGVLPWIVGGIRRADPQRELLNLMKIAFALPCSGRYPNGGFRVIYEYANRLVGQGHEVTLCHATDPNFFEATWRQQVWSCIRWMRNLATGLYLPKWIQLDPRIETRCSLLVDVGQASRFDAVIATAWQTAATVASLQGCRKFYFIQGFENRSGEAPAILETWKLPLKKIVISQWLREMVINAGGTCLVLPNAVDDSLFYPTTSIEARNPASVLLQLHPKALKGTQDALDAIRILRERGVQFELGLFGLAEAGDFTVPGPFDYDKNPSQERLCQLYGQSAIFITASHSEGWGLTAHEACACGAAVVATDIGGHREFLEDKISALLSPPKDPQALADNIQRLIIDQRLRQAIALAGRASAKRFSYSHTVPMLETYLGRAQ